MVQKKIVSQVKRNGVSRRTFLKGSAGAIAAALSATSGSKFMTQGIFAPRIARAQNNTVVLAIQEFAHDAIKAVIPEFEEATGLTVTFESGPASGNDMMTRYSSAFAAGTSPVDVLSDADETMPVFARAGWLTPLDDIIPEEVWADFPESLASHIETWHMFDGARYRIPHEFAIGYLFTRADWLDERNLTAPTTWEEMVDIGKEFADPDNNVWGTTDGLLKPGLLYVYVAYLTAQAGGSIFDFDEGTADAFQFLYDMIHTHRIFPETALNNDYTAQNALYMGDSVAFMRQWPYFQSFAEGDTEWYAPEKVKIELPPAGPAGSKSWFGGWGFDIPKFAPNPDGAAALINFLTSNDIFPQLAHGQSWFLVPRASVLESFEGEDNPIVNAQGAYSEAGVPFPRPFHPRVAEAQIVVDDMASLFLSDQASLSDVMSQGQELIAALAE